MPQPVCHWPAGSEPAAVLPVRAGQVMALPNAVHEDRSNVEHRRNHHPGNKGRPARMRVRDTAEVLRVPEAVG